MIKNIKIEIDIIEMMHYYWQATSENEKVGENYIINISNMKGMKYLYNDEFSEESIRKVLSAISNREILNDASKCERKFWNNNMWLLEDMEFTNMMVNPVKLLNLDDLIEKLNDETMVSYEEIEILFIPGHLDEYYIDENKLIINFFRLMPDLYGEEDIKIGELELKKYIEQKIIENMK